MVCKIVHLVDEGSSNGGQDSHFEKYAFFISLLFADATAGTRHSHICVEDWNVYLADNESRSGWVICPYLLIEEILVKTY